MSKRRLLSLCLLLELCLICSIAVAAMFSGPRFALFYHGLYGLGFSFALPLLYMHKEGAGLASAGVAGMGKKQWIVLAAFVLFSIGGQLLPLMLNGSVIQWGLLKRGFFPLVMTTFFEEFLFRGFFQTRFEKAFGWPLALLLSAMMFSLYHLGYPGFRTPQDILLLFAVGLGFAAAFKLSGNNLLVAYFVNLPNAFVTYILKSAQFPPFDRSAIIFSAFTALLIAIVLFFVKKNFTAALNEDGRP